MSKTVHRHPEDIELLRYADGELPAREARTVRTHLETCWQCRTTLEELQSSIAGCVRYRREIQTHLPSPPAPWMDIYVAFSRADATAGRVSFLTRMRQAWRQTNRWPVAVAAAGAVLAVVLLELRETPAVQAATLLRKAAAAESSRPAAPRRIRVRTRTHSFTRTVGMVAIRERRVAQEAESSVAPLFAAAHYNWEDPLSARSYQAWREQLPSKRDQVQDLGREGYRLRTETDSGELVSASLTLGAGDFRAVQGRLEFRNREWVEMAEMPAEPSAPLSVTASAPAAPAPGPARVAEETSAPARQASLGDELQVVAKLHGVGADLGDPVEVRRSAGQVVVSGVGVSAEREQQIREALESMPRVVVQFSQPADAPGAAGEAHSIDTQATSAGLRFQQRIERQLGGRVQFERFSAGLLDLNEAAMARAYALRRLAQQFPVSAGKELTAAERGTLVRLGREHADALLHTELQMEQLLNPVLAPLGGSANAVQQNMSTTGAWQTTTEGLFRDARRVETLLAAMLDVSPKAGSSQDLPSQVLTGLAQLRARLENYRHLLAQDPGGTGR